MKLPVLPSASDSVVVPPWAYVAGVVLALILFLIWVSKRARFLTTQKTPILLFQGIRTSYSYPILSITVGTAIIVYGASIQYQLTEIVLVTLFYATVLFLGNVFQTDRPFPIITSEQIVYDEEYRNPERVEFDGLAGEDTERNAGFEYEFSVQNIGNEDLLAPEIEYKVYSSNYEVIQGWRAVPNTSRNSVRISPTDEPKSFSITGTPVSNSNEPDYYLSLRIRPRRGNRVLCCRWIKPIGNDE